MAEPTPDVEADPTPEEAQLQSHSCQDTAGRPVQASTRRMSPAGQTRGIRWLLSLAGPGLITGAADDDPSGIATYVQTGAQFGYGQLWTALFVLPLMTAVQEASARVGAVTGKGLAAVMREQFSPWLAYPIVLLLLIANTINIGADIGAMAESAGLIVPLPFIVLALIFTISIAAREIFTPYARYVKILKWLAVSLLAYPITMFVVHEPWGTILRATLLPHVELSSAFLFILTAVLGTTITPYMFYWQASQEVEEERRRGLLDGRGRPRIGLGFIRDLQADNASGMVASQFVSWCIIIVGATALHAHGITTVNSAADAARALLPLVHGFAHAGFLSELLFALGIVGLGLLAMPVLAGSSAYAVAEVSGWPEGLNLRVNKAIGFYVIITLGMVIGLLINFLGGINPIRMLVVAAVINGVVATPIIAVLALLAANKSVMGEYRSGWLSRVLVWLACLGMAGAAVVLILSTF